MAPEFYDNLPCHNSWIKVLYDFITSPEMGPYSRVLRDYKYTSEYAILNRNKLDDGAPVDEKETKKIE